MSEFDDQIDNLRLELRRGVVVLAVLSQLDSAQYGYSLIQRLAERGLDVEEGTLYPLLRRLEKQGLLESKWDTSETRPRKYYQLSKQGHKVLATLTADWFETVDVMRKLLFGEGKNNV
jgi:DNA-binding PadR family transcriptional regulator